MKRYWFKGDNDQLYFHLTRKSLNDVVECETSDVRVFISATARLEIRFEGFNGQQKNSIVKAVLEQMIK